MVDWDGTEEGSLIDVPVLIGSVTNRFDDKNSDNLTNKDGWTLKRRFFLFDTISGIEEGEYPDGVPQLVRYPKTMTLLVELDKEERITVPVLYIDYKTRRNEYIQ